MMTMKMMIMTMMMMIMEMTIMMIMRIMVKNKMAIIEVLVKLPGLNQAEKTES